MLQSFQYIQSFVQIQPSWVFEKDSRLLFAKITAKTGCFGTLNLPKIVFFPQEVAKKLNYPLLIALSAPTETLRRGSRNRWKLRNNCKTFTVTKSVQPQNGNRTYFSVPILKCCIN